MEENSIKIIFLKILIEKLINLSYRERIIEILPKEFHQILFLDNPEAVLEYVQSIFYYKIIFRYDDINAINHADCEIIKDKLNSKLSGEEMIAFIKNKSNNIDAIGYLIIIAFIIFILGELLFDIFFQTILFKSR